MAEPQSDTPAVDVIPTFELSALGKLSLAAAAIACVGGTVSYMVLIGDNAEASQIYLGMFLVSVVSVALGGPGAMELHANKLRKAAFIQAQLEKQSSELIPDFTATHKLLSSPFNASQPAILIDDQRQKVCLLNQMPDPSPRIFPYQDLLGVEIVEDGLSVVATKTSRTSQLGSALVGGVLFGGAGAIVGGLSGKTVSTAHDRVNAVQLRLLVDDISHPHFVVDFLGKQVSKLSAEYSSALAQARQWHGVLEVLIRRMDAEDQHHLAAPPAFSYVADELRKLAQLKSDGILTEEEFQSQKQDLLSQTP